MFRNRAGDFNVSPQFLQHDTMPGLLQGQVVDVRDPWRMGRVRVQIYGLHGDYPGTDIQTLMWCQPMHPGRGAFMPPQLGDRVLVSFESGDKYAPMIIGHLYATPMGDGMLPWNKREGTEIHPMGWHHHDMYPESLILAASGNGNVIGVTDVFLTKDEDGAQGNLVSSINMIDTGGKFFRIRSFHLDERHWSPVTKFPVGEGTLYKTDYGENEAVRKGTETVDKDYEDPLTGSIEFGTQRLKKEVIGSEGDFSLDQTTQKTDEDTVSFESQSLGDIHKTRQGGVNLAMMQDMMFLNGLAGVAINRLYLPPRRWDSDSDAETRQSNSSGGDEQVA